MDKCCDHGMPNPKVSRSARGSGDEVPTIRIPKGANTFVKSVDLLRIATVGCLAKPRQRRGTWRATIQNQIHTNFAAN